MQYLILCSIIIISVFITMTGLCNVLGCLGKTVGGITLVIQGNSTAEQTGKVIKHTFRKCVRLARRYSGTVPCFWKSWKIGLGICITRLTHMLPASGSALKVHVKASHRSHRSKKLVQWTFSFYNWGCSLTFKLPIQPWINAPGTHFLWLQLGRRNMSSKPAYACTWPVLRTDHRPFDLYWPVTRVLFTQTFMRKIDS